VIKKACINSIKNPHFWIIVILILSISFLYYFSFRVKLTDPEWNVLWRLIVFEYNNHLNGILFYLPFIYVAVIFSLKGLLITWIFTLIIALPRIYVMSYSTAGFILNILFLLIPLLIVIIFAILTQWRRVDKQVFRERERERRTYIAQILTAQEDERKRIAREIHDDTTQRLWIVADRVQKLARKKSGEISEEISDELVSINQTILGISNDAKRLSLDLRPSVLDDLGLAQAIEWLVENIDQSIDAQLVVNGTEQKLDNLSEIMVFRFVQEALNNIRKHASATQVIVDLNYDDEKIKISISDNGTGFKLEKDISQLALRSQLGLLGLQERARMLGGTLDIQSEVGKGTCIGLEFKIPSISSKDLRNDFKH